MSDAIAKQLEREARPWLRPFFATRVSAAARDENLLRRCRWLAVYWIAASFAIVYILMRAPLSAGVVRTVAPAVVPAIIVFAGFYRKPIRRVARSLFR